MTPFKTKENYIINEISGDLRNLNSLYLTNTNNTFLICQLYNSYLYPLVVYAKGKNLKEIMYANHSSLNLNSQLDTIQIDTPKSYKWFYQVQIILYTI